MEKNSPGKDRQSSPFSPSPFPLPPPSAQSSAFIDLKNYHLWDFAGVDGLQLAKKLVGDRAVRIAPFQSCEAQLLNFPCSVLRLCEGNFRIGIQGQVAEIETILQKHQAGLKVWLKPCRAMQAITLTETLGLKILPQLMTAKPPYRLKGLQNNCAVPARLDGMAVLCWRHAIAGAAVVELHVGAKDIALQSTLKRYCC
ncbi:MAG: hypothetical protein ACFB4I_25030 [Cyanophyceae cyanobacterium]